MRRRCPIVLCLLLGLSVVSDIRADSCACGRDYPVPTPVTNTVTPPPRRDVCGLRLPLEKGTLYIPCHFQPGPRVDVAVFLHGADWVVQQEFESARKNAILVTVSGQQLSEISATPSAFTALVDLCVDTVAARVHTQLDLGRVCLASFSGGYATARDILSHPEARAVISDLLLADSLYGTKRQGSPPRMEPAAMEPFLTLARMAARGEKVLWFTQLYPPEEQYRTNTTTLAADYLVEELELERSATEELTSRGICVLYTVDGGGFHLRGYAGMSNQDHMEHLYTVGELFAASSLADVVSGVLDPGIVPQTQQ